MAGERRKWKKFDALQKGLWPHQVKYVRAAYREAEKFFGRNFHQTPALRLAIQRWSEPSMALALAMAERDALKRKKAGGNTQ